MALPKLETPKHYCFLPTNGKRVNYRPFLVGEQKLLLIAQESENQNDMLREMMRLIEICTDDVKVRELTSTTTASKLSALGGDAERIGLMLLENVDSSFLKNSVVRRADNLYRTWQRNAFAMVEGYSAQEQKLALEAVRGSKAKVSARVNNLADTLKKELNKYQDL